MNTKYSDSVRADALYLADHLRPSDLEELEAAGIRTSEARKEAILVALYLEGECHTLMVDGVPAAMFGVVDMGNGKGSPWLLGTTVLDTQKRRLLTDARVVVQNMMQQYNALENYIYEGSKINRRWLRWLGFSEDAPQPHPVTGEPFIRFHWRES